jgi:hypothetical protein
VVGFGKLECSCTPKHFDDYIETEDDDAKSSNSNNVINTQPIKHVTPCQKCRLDQPLQNDFYPIVDFDDGSSFVIPPCEYSREAILPDGTKMKTCGMTIIPLIAAWAITSHRSQGITLSNRPVHINAAQMERAFGAFYVSFSRCTSMSQVSIENFKGFQQNPVARQFYEGKYKIPSPKLYTDQQNVEFLSDERILNGFENFKDELQPTHLSSEKTSAWIKNALSSSTCSFLDLEYEMEKTIKPILREVIDKFSSLRRPKKRKREIIDRLETYIKEYSKKLS